MKNNWIEFGGQIINLRYIKLFDRITRESIINIVAVSKFAAFSEVFDTIEIRDKRWDELKNLLCHH